MLEFEWDLAKEGENIRKHKISFMESLYAFFDKNGFELEDVKHSKKEKRKFWVGKIGNGRIITVRFTRRRNVIRIIGAAEWREFRRLYHGKTKDK